MVRVISVHHFANQHIQVVEQPTACTVAPPNRLLLALMSNCIEVRDLSNDSEVLFSFPTVDEVVQLVHCLNGDYVATLETKFNRQNKELNFVRVYINWDSIATLQQSKMTSSGISLGSSECGMVQPMRARIAGRVTPTTNQSELGSLEMIEVPVKRNPNFVDCCQISGNLLILSENIINIYTFHIKMHDISKMKFVDFEEIPLLIQMSFSPHCVAFCENYIACMSKDTFHLFKICESIGREANDLNLCGDNDFNFSYSNISGPIDYKKLLREEKSNNKEKITVNLPMIIEENSLIHKSSPFISTDGDILALIIGQKGILDNKNIQYKIENLIQLRLMPILIESAQRQVTEEFKSFVLKPIYVEQYLNDSANRLGKRFLHSDFNQCLNSVVCIIATQQEGYLYHFDDNEKNLNQDNCLAIYPFTAPVFKLVMEEYFLHALTETGLESYTLRYGHQMCRNFENIDNINVACPQVCDSICLVGLRPFLGVEQILLTENHMVLLANSETSPAHSTSSNSSSNASFLTLYNLELPTPRMIFNDICIVANVHRFTSVQTYCHLMSEAHMILRLVLLLKKWSMTENNVKLLISRVYNKDDIAEMYRISCALLGDHYVMCNNEIDYTLAVPYYKMARIMPAEVLKRVKKIQEQSGNVFTKGLMYYLKKTLLDVKAGPDADKTFGSSSKQNFSETILDLLEHHAYDDLPNLILKSKIFREYSTDKLINILTEKITENFKYPAEKNLALSLLYIQKCNADKAQMHLDKITRDNLCLLILDNYELLFETTVSPQNKNKVTTFSEFTILLITICPDLLSTLFVNLMMEKKVISLNKLIKVFLEYLPSSIGSDSSSASMLLQKTLETYFERYFSKPENVDLSKIIYERGASEAMKLLVRSYLSQLQILQLKDESNKDGNNSNRNESVENDIFEDENDDTKKDRHQEKFGYNRINKTYFEEQEKKPKDCYLFSSLRWEYLDKMPPFQIEIISKLYEACIENYPVKQQWPLNEEADSILKKLQALLCSQVVPKQVLAEVNGYLSVNESLRGNISLQSILMSTNDAILLLIDSCPQCLLQFGKDRFAKTDEWKFLIATVQCRILRLSQNENLKRVCFFHKKILKDILTYVASNMTLDQLILVFPQRFSTNNLESNQKADCDLYKSEVVTSDEDTDILKEIQNYEPYVIICKETMHANQIHDLITTTAQQLLCTLNL